MPIIIEERDNYLILAKGSHPDLSKLIRLKRDQGKWTGPVRIIRNDARLITDGEYYRGIMVKPVDADERRQARFILDTLHEGLTSFDTIASHLGLPRERVEKLVYKYKLRRSHWQARRDKQIIDADSAAEMASKLNKPPYLVKNVARSGQLVNGYKIYRYYEMRSKVWRNKK
ncbi:hypothetical protein [Lactiplantibacillus brownii]|uniref:hypothetical protein n=1 Tax=Lactiplantibacillus brownii TaxID=3069269 RepID=UPI0038B4164D